MDFYTGLNTDDKISLWKIVLATPYDSLWGMLHLETRVPQFISNNNVYITILISWSYLWIHAPKWSILFIFIVNQARNCLTLYRNAILFTIIAKISPNHAALFWIQKTSLNSLMEGTDKENTDFLFLKLPRLHSKALKYKVEVLSKQRRREDYVIVSVFVKPFFLWATHS